MRHRWYGDLRDLLKWTVVGGVVEKYGIRSVVYVSYLAKDEERGEVHLAVWRHFRPMASLETLVSELGASFASVPGDFSHKGRRLYLESAIRTLEGVPGPRLVLLDPDTGLQPTKATQAHTTHREVRALWDRLEKGDWLAVYQHAWRKEGWKEEATRRLQGLLPENSEVQCEHRVDIVKDAAILLAKKRRVPVP